MKLEERIINDLKEAMKKQDKFSLSVLRMLKSAIQMESIALKKELTDDEVMTVIKRNVKQRSDSLNEFKKYNKQDEVASLEQEIALLKTYLPAELSTEEINAKIDEVFKQLNPTSIKDMGHIMQELTKQIGNQADMGYVSKAVKEKLMSL